MFIKTAFVTAVSVSLLSFAGFDLGDSKRDDTKTDKSTAKGLGDWKKDPVCRAVYSGVLKGLEKDNVSLQIVDNLVGKFSTKAQRGDRLKRSFVIDCPLCEPTFDALVAYQAKLSKRAVQDAKSKTGLSEKEQKGLSSEITMNRLRALAPVVKRWMKAEFASNTQLTIEQMNEWKKRVAMRFQEGKTKLISHISDSKDYKDWSPYWGCAACNGSRDAADTWKTK